MDSGFIWQLRKIWRCYLTARNRVMNRVLSAFFPKYNTQKIFERAFGRKIDWENLIDINDKIQWLKLNTYYRNDTITQCVDKYRVREYLEEKA